MDRHDDLAAAIAGFLGAEPMTIADIRARLVAAGHDVPGPDAHGADATFRAVQMTPEFMALDDAASRLEANAPADVDDPAATALDDVRVIRTADVIAGIPFIVAVNDDGDTGAASDRLVDETLESFVWVIIGERLASGSDLTDDDPSSSPVRLVDADGDEIGRLGITERALDRGSTDALVGPDGWLGDHAGHHVTLIVTDPSRGALTVQVSRADGPAPITEQQQDVVRAAFEHAAGVEEIDHPMATTSVRVTSPDRLLFASLLHDRTVFEAGVGSIVDVADAAGLEVSERRHTIGAPGTDWEALDVRARSSRLQWEHGLDADQAALTMMLVGCALEVDERGSNGFGETDDEQIGAIALMANALDDAQVADAAWQQWAELDAIPQRLDEIADHFAEIFDETKLPGVEWLRARLALEHGNPLEAEQILRGAVTLRASRAGSGGPHAGVATLLAGIEADRGDAFAAKRLLDQIPDIDDDEQHRFLGDDRLSDADRIRREIEPYLTRPKAQVGRNERCPCGSGRKYKQCHLGSEQHPLSDRSGWLYAKASRYLHERNPDAVWDVADRIVGPGGSEEAADEIAATHLPIDLLLHEGGVFEDWLAARGELLPADERELAERWAATNRRLFEVNLSNQERLELVAHGTDDRVLVEEWLPVEPLPTGMLVAARPLPVGASTRLLGGLCPVDPQYAEIVVDACAEGELDGVIDAIGLTFHSFSG